MASLSPIVLALFGGILPALLWLMFFLHEDRHPEPRALVVVSFLAGMLAVAVVIPLEQLSLSLAGGGRTPVLAWAAIEELVKFAAAVAFILWREAVDEPIDVMIYLVTIALGFAALESGLFLLAPFQSGDYAGGLMTGNFRFIGAALLHTLSSAVVGFFVALTFYRSAAVQFYALCTGLVLATTLHALFNFFILSTNGEKTAYVFFFVWLGIVGMFLLFEQAKRVTRTGRTVIDH